VEETFFRSVEESISRPLLSISLLLIGPGRWGKMKKKYLSHVHNLSNSENGDQDFGILTILSYMETRGGKGKMEKKGKLIH